MPQPALRPEPALRLNRAMRESLDVLRFSPFELRRHLARRLSENPFLQPAELSPADEEKRLHFEEISFRREDSLTQHLCDQLGFLGFSDAERSIAEEIAGRVNPDGYLGSPLEEIAEACGVSPETALRVLARVQTLEPSGVAARDVRECLLLQIDECEIGDAALKRIARTVLERHFDDLTHRRFSRIAARLEISLERCQEAVRHIRRLNPRPGLQIAGSATPLRISEMKWIARKGGWRVLYERSWLPVGLTPGCAAWLKNPSIPEEEKKKLREHLQRALSLLKGLEERQKTLTRLARFLTEKQDAFLRRGGDRLRPLRLRDAARALGVHPSTVSRAVAHKYVDTPQGVLSLRSLFSRPMKNLEAFSVSHSREHLCSLLRKWILRENKARPLTDARLAALFREGGFAVARRTVAQYRSKNGILPASYRKRSA